VASSIDRELDRLDDKTQEQAVLRSRHVAMPNRQKIHNLLEKGRKSPTGNHIGLRGHIYTKKGSEHSGMQRIASWSQ
jgi:hypothetical protein